MCQRYAGHRGAVVAPDSPLVVQMVAHPRLIHAEDSAPSAGSVADADGLTVSPC